jgi:hypothetical protein
MAVIVALVLFENLSRELQVFCQSGWSYSLRSADPNGPADVGAVVSMHGCGGDRNPFWILLPGESRFDSYEVKPTRTIAWKGCVTDALAAGRKPEQRKQPR